MNSHERIREQALPRSQHAPPARIARKSLVRSRPTPTHAHAQRVEHAMHAARLRGARDGWEPRAVSEGDSRVKVVEEEDGPAVRC